LIGVVIEQRVAPALGENLLLNGRADFRGGRLGWCYGCGSGWAWRTRGRGRIRAAEFNDDGDRTGHATGPGGGKDEVGFDVDGDGRIGGVVDVANEVSGGDRDAIVVSGSGGDDLPVNGGNIGGDAAQDLAVKEFDELRTALGPPDFGGLDRLAVVENKRVGQVGPRVGFGFIPVDGVGTLAVLGDAGTQRGDVEQVEHALMVLGRRELDGAGGSWADDVGRCRRLYCLGKPGWQQDDEDQE
jgi:hypothetical protein